MINDDLDEEEVSWYYSTRMVSWYDGLRTRMNGVWLSANVIVTQLRPQSRHRYASIQACRPQITSLIIPP